MTKRLDEAAQPSTDELRSFDIGLRDGMLDPKHVRNMGSATGVTSISCASMGTSLQPVRRMAISLR